ncbi:MAG: acyl carrier protein [Eubacteriales bacterium]|nr:acyl carrier protein [Eubacteriales bacterium]
MTEKEKLNLLEETLDVDEGTLSMEQNLVDVEEYDSMAKLSVIVMMEDEFGVKLSSDEVKAFTTVADIINRME